MNNLSKVKKINFYVEKIVECGLLDYLISELNPSLIILFGSIRKGDSIKESDIDIFIETCVDKKLDLKNFEKKLGHNIEIFLETDMNNLQKNLFNNIINGISLFGRVKVK
jgi:predicted nucleotidyltransferase